MSYLDFLNLLFSWGVRLKDHWPKILAVYTALKDLYDAIGEQSTTDGTLSLTTFTPAEQEAEAKVQELLAGDAQQLNLAGLYQVFMLLKSTGILDKLIGKAFGS